MSIADPAVIVVCDGCKEISTVDMVELGNDRWASVNMKEHLIRTGWHVNDDVTICPYCMAEH